MDGPEQLPLDEAVSRGVIPCGRCGATGAQVREVDGKKHFLCPRCARRPVLWTGGFLLLTVVLLALAAWLSGGTDSGEDLKSILSSIEADLSAKRAEEALARARSALTEHPDAGSIHCVAGQALLALRRAHEAANHFRKALELGGDESELCVFGLGRALMLSNRSTESLLHLEKPFTDTHLDLFRRRTLSEVYLEIERYEDALGVLDTLESDLAAFSIRFRALSYLGKADEARAAAAAFPSDKPLARVTVAILEASLLREEGKFDEAETLLQKMRDSEPEESINRFRLARSLLAVYLEAGKLDLLLSGADALITEGRAPYVAQAMGYRVLGLLLSNRREEARQLAETFLKLVPPEASAYRQDRLMMSHLVGKATADEVAAEAAATSRVRANDLYFFLAAATGDRTWAEKARDGTPRHNFPYHAIRRFLER